MIFQDPYSSLNPRMLVKDIINEPLDINDDLKKIKKPKKLIGYLKSRTLRRTIK